jgi:hypothetical protein
MARQVCGSAQQGPETDPVAPDGVIVYLSARKGTKIQFSFSVHTQDMPVVNVQFHRQQVMLMYPPARCR